jgi:hypothetical protein
MFIIFLFSLIFGIIFKTIQNYHDYNKSITQTLLVPIYTNGKIAKYILENQAIFSPETFESNIGLIIRPAYLLTVVLYFCNIPFADILLIFYIGILLLIKLLYRIHVNNSELIITIIIMNTIYVREIALLIVLFKYIIFDSQFFLLQTH